MSRNYIPINQVVNDFVVTLDTDDYASSATDTAIRSLALRGVRELGFDTLKVVRSLKLSVSANNTVTLPDDYIDWTKVGSVGTDGLVYVLAENKNLNMSQKYSTINGISYDTDGDGLLEREDDKTSTGGASMTTNDYVFRNYYNNREVGSLYGYGGGHFQGEFRVNLDQNRLEIESNSNITEVVIEYISDEARSTNPRVHVYAEEALRCFIYYKIIERKSSVPANEKARARAEYYNERRKANARMKSFTKEEALKTIRKNYKQAPKA